MTALPSDGLLARITNAVDAAFPPNPETGRRGQASRVEEAMERLYGEQAPHITTVIRWMRGEFKSLTIDAAYRLAVALGADPVALVFGDLVPQWHGVTATADAAVLRAGEEQVLRDSAHPDARSEAPPRTETDDRREGPRGQGGAG